MAHLVDNCVYYSTLPLRSLVTLLIFIVLVFLFFLWIVNCIYKPSDKAHDGEKNPVASHIRRTDGHVSEQLHTY